MTLAEALRPALSAARGIAGSLGLHPFRVYVTDRSWSSSPPGEGTPTDSATELLENGQPPKLRTVSGEVIALNNLESGSITVGPLTPQHSAGGVSLDTFQSALTSKQERFLRVVGPGKENGVLFRITDVETDRALHYTVTAAPVQEQSA